MSSSLVDNDRHALLEQIRVTTKINSFIVRDFTQLCAIVIIDLVFRKEKNYLVTLLTFVVCNISFNHSLLLLFFSLCYVQIPSQLFDLRAVCCGNNELFLAPWNKTLKYLNYFLLGFYSKV
jgi:hypothetical protein